MGISVSTAYARLYDLVAAHAAVSCGTAAEEGYRLLKKMHTLAANDWHATFYSGVDGTKKNLDLRDFLQGSPDISVAVDIPVFEDYIPEEYECYYAAAVADWMNEQASTLQDKATGHSVLMAAIAMVGYAIDNHGVLRVNDD